MSRRLLLSRRFATLPPEQWKHHRTPYEILDIPKTSPKKQIKERFLQLSLKYHPDRALHLEDNEKDANLEDYLVIKTAYDLLSDEKRREWYDRGMLSDVVEGRRTNAPGFHAETPKQRLNEDLNILKPFAWGFGTVVACCTLMQWSLQEEAVDREKEAWDAWYAQKKKEGLSDVVDPIPTPMTSSTMTNIKKKPSG